MTPYTGYSISRDYKSVTFYEFTKSHMLLSTTPHSIDKGYSRMHRYEIVKAFMEQKQLQMPAYVPNLNERK